MPLAIRLIKKQLAGYIETLCLLDFQQYFFKTISTKGFENLTFQNFLLYNLPEFGSFQGIDVQDFVDFENMLDLSIYSLPCAIHGVDTEM